MQRGLVAVQHEQLRGSEAMDLPAGSDPEEPPAPVTSTRRPAASFSGSAGAIQPLQRVTP
jgi:hypothetical protein